MRYACRTLTARRASTCGRPHSPGRDRPPVKVGHEVAPGVELRERRAHDRSVLDGPVVEPGLRSRLAALRRALIPVQYAEDLDQRFRDQRLPKGAARGGVVHSRASTSKGPRGSRQRSSAPLVLSASSARRIHRRACPAPAPSVSRPAVSRRWADATSGGEHFTVQLVDSHPGCCTLNRLVSLVLLASVRNADRTQMATAWLNALTHPGKVRAVSAGTTPASALDENVIAAMKEVGVDISLSTPRLLTPLLEHSAGMLIVLAPPLPDPPVRGVGEFDEWVADDSAGKPLDRVRQIRDEIERMVRDLLVANRWMPFGASTPPSP
jgi:arsenate reductase